MKFWSWKWINGRFGEFEHKFELTECKFVSANFSLSQAQTAWKGQVYMNLNEKMVSKIFRKRWTASSQIMVSIGSIVLQFVKSINGKSFDSVLLRWMCQIGYFCFSHIFFFAAENMNFWVAVTNKTKDSLFIILMCFTAKAFVLSSQPNNASVRFDRISKPVITDTAAELEQLSRTLHVFRVSSFRLFRLLITVLLIFGSDHIICVPNQWTNSTAKYHTTNGNSSHAVRLFCMNIFIQIKHW